MNNGKLIILAGASSAGKSTLARTAEGADGRFVVLEKTTNRPPRSKDEDPNPDNQYDPSLGDIRGNKDLFIYYTNGSAYGINIARIKREMERGKWVILIVNHYLAIQHLRRLFPGQTMSPTTRAPSRRKAKINSAARST